MIAETGEGGRGDADDGMSQKRGIIEAKTGVGCGGAGRLRSIGSPRNLKFHGGETEKGKTLLSIQLSRG